MREMYRSSVPTAKFSMIVNSSHEGRPFCASTKNGDDKRRRRRVVGSNDEMENVIMVVVVVVVLVVLVFGSRGEL